MATPKKYSHINFSPPEAVQNAARRGLELRRKHGRGGLDTKEASRQGIGSGVQRATNLANGNTVSPETVARMVSFFARHEKNKDSRTDSGEPGAGMIAWLLWGGNPGQRWANKVKRQMDKADGETKKALLQLSKAVVVHSGGRATERLTYKSGAHTGAMVALFLPLSLAKRLAIPGGEPAEELHITLAYLGEAVDIEDPDMLLEIVGELAAMTTPFEGLIQGVGRFCNSDSEGDPFILLPDFVNLSLFRELFLVNELQRNGIEVAKNHGFMPHITLKYIDENDPLPLQSIPPIPLKIDKISVVLAGARHDFLLGSGRKVERIGARHTGKEYEMIQQGHDLANKLGAECEQEAMASKAGARHSQKDTLLIQRIHDDFHKLGAVCQRKRKAMPMSVKELTGKAAMGELIQLSQAVTVARGGRGSGNWGHVGRPGKHGGSRSGGGLKAIGAKPDSSVKERRKASARKKQSGKKGGSQGSDKKPPGSSKLDDILDKAPKDQADFTNHLMGKVQSGEISFSEAQELQSRFASAPKAKTFSASQVSGDVPRGKVYDGQELQGGAATRKWDKWANGLPAKEREALLDYQSELFDERKTDYTQINNHLRGKDRNPSKETRAAVRDMDRALNKSRVPEDTVAYRGFPASVLGDDPQSLVGKTIQDKGYTSTSLSRRTASEFSKEVMAEVRVPKGARGGLLDSLRSGKDAEHELLLPRGSNFRVLAVEKSGGRTNVVMELVE